MHKARIAQWKREEVSRLKKLIENYKVIAIADMTGMPSPQLQRVRFSIKGTTIITMGKASLINIALNELKDKINGIEKLLQYIKGMPALLLTNNNPFKLAGLLKKSRSMAPAKPGQVSPNDIIVPAGPTPFPPGPIMGELGSCGLKAGVVDGKVAIKEDKIVAKEGDVISPQVAAVLTKLGIEPMEVGINLLAVYENGVIFTKSILEVDEKVILNNIKSAIQGAFNLAFYIVYPTKGNIKLLVRKAYLGANAIVEKGNLTTNKIVEKKIQKVSLEAENLKEKLNLPEDIPGESSEVKKKVSIVGEEWASQKREEQVAQDVLKKLQDKKIGEIKSERKDDRVFREQEKKAQDILKKIQDEKIEKEERTKFKPRGL